jgi:N-acetyl-gamma-glutamyl-phosphate reductase
MIKAAVIGAGGYGGVGVTELLLRHPEAKILRLVDVENVGMPISDLYPHLRGFCDMRIAGDDSGEPADVAFMATPDRVGMKAAPALLQRGTKVVDYSGDFRFNSVEAYAAYASRIGLETKHASPELLPASVYGLPELHRDRLTAATRLVGNPGCFAVSCILGLSPAVRERLVEAEGLICDCKTGVSGAGKKPKPGFHFPAMHDHMAAYRLSGHQHVCEIERELGLQAGREIRVTFTAQVVPLCRGIMSCLYGRLTKDASEEDALAVYRAFYKASPFVRVLGSASGVGTSHVRGTNYCNLVVSVDARTRMLRVVSHIDNLVKGQAGSAVQNMNLLFGLPETAGLDRPGMYP